LWRIWKPIASKGRVFSPFAPSSHSLASLSGQIISEIGKSQVNTATLPQKDLNCLFLVVLRN
jgi:hypothetical protein